MSLPKKTISKAEERHLRRHWVHLVVTKEEYEILNAFLDEKKGIDWRKKRSDQDDGRLGSSGKPIEAVHKGFLADIVVQSGYFGITPVIECFSDNSDDGIDFSYKGLSYDVKTVTGGNPVLNDPYLKMAPNIQTVKDLRNSWRCDRMILAGVPRTGRVRLYGYTDYQHFVNNMIQHDFGHGKRYALAWHQLMPMHNIDIRQYKVFLKYDDERWGAECRIPFYFNDVVEAKEFIITYPLGKVNAYQIVLGSDIVDEGKIR